MSGHKQAASYFRPFVTLLLALGLTACTTGNARVPVPISLANKVSVNGAKGFGPVRAWADAPLPNVKLIADTRSKQMEATRPEVFKQRRRTVSYLALSGGGSNGAYGAGYLAGWSKSGKRPDFEVVSGVSAGALIAPFAFLGPAYDRQLKEIYTLYSTKDILKPMVLAGLLGAESVSSSEPLQKLIAKYVDRPFLAAVAREHNRGRRLIIGTTNLDAERPVIWNMGLIASSDNDNALALFRKVLLASASLPGVFPPVFIDVSADGQLFQEMHVDGGTTENTFLLPMHLNIHQYERKVVRGWKHQAFVVVNDKIDPNPVAVKPSALAIAGRSITTMIKQQTEGDLIKLYLRAKKNNIKFRMNSIPVSFKEKSNEPFDRSYMTKLFELGFQNGMAQAGWRKSPPGI